MGDRLRVRKAGVVFEGFLLPREDIDLGDPDCLLLKLDNGYNVGVKIGPSAAIERLEGGVELERFERPSPVEQNPSLPHIALLSTGGTIASRIDYYTGAVAPYFSPDEVLQGVPEVGDLVYIRSAERLFSLFSENMAPLQWAEVARRSVESLAEEVSGVIILHGTDTMHYTAAALSFMVREPRAPVILVGAQRSSDRGSRDADMNLICASHIAAKADIAEVGICMHGQTDDTYCSFLRGTKTRKMHTARRDAFRPVNDLPLLRVWPDGRIEHTNPSFRRRSEAETWADAVFEERTALLKVYPGAPPSLLDHLVDRGYRGVVLEGTGLGHVPTEPLEERHSWLPAVRRAVEEGVVVAVTSQCLYGRTSTYVYRSARFLTNAGAIYAEDMLPEVAYVKLGWLLGHEYNVEEVKRLMTTSMAGEISPRVRADTFLI